jgi:hypothetical protein
MRYPDSARRALACNERTKCVSAGLPVMRLRIDIVILLADATRTGGWSASPDGGCTRIARLRGAARQDAGKGAANAPRFTLP